MQEERWERDSRERGWFGGIEGRREKDHSGSLLFHSYHCFILTGGLQLETRERKGAGDKFDQQES